MKLDSTPGPWGVSNLTDVFTELGAPDTFGRLAHQSDGWQIADASIGMTMVDDGEWSELKLSEQQANARLIAAAPEMLGLLIECAKAFRAVGEYGWDGELVIEAATGKTWEKLNDPTRKILP